jgi:tRNA(His) guanylyltransferase
MKQARRAMANSRFERMKQFERADTLLPDAHVCLRIDGSGFKRLASQLGWVKPWDDRALMLMRQCAEDVMQHALPDSLLAYGHSDEFTFVLPSQSTLQQRREHKLVSLASSVMSSSFVLHHSSFFGFSVPPECVPAFHGRVAVLPTQQHVHKYLSWRQADCVSLKPGSPIEHRWMLSSI